MEDTMVTKSKDKIEKARLLLRLVTQKREIEKQERELKDYFKSEITDGCLDAGDVLIVVKRQTRVTLDRKALELELGKKIKDFELPTEYEIVLVESKKEAS
jgi:predicted protein tyrosine phosphatase